MTDQTEAQRLVVWLKNEGAWHQMTLGDVEAAGRELRRLQAENLELRKDAERLDWLEKDQASRVFHIVNNWYTRKSYGMPWTKRKDLRAAIDAAKDTQ